MTCPPPADATVDVLIVDDEPTTREIVATYLRHYGIGVATCADGTEMWAAIGRATPQIVILDVQMPGEDGFTLAEQLRRRFAYSVSIIMLTGRNRPLDIASGMAVAADDYLIKPCDWRQLVSIVRRNLAYRYAVGA